MISPALEKARSYEEKEGNKVSPDQRPLFHLSPRVGWMNDPNGFSWHNGEYHLFYQYYPYCKTWGPMHWGHAVSKDLIHWNYLPAVLAPDIKEDLDGCFSGSAIDLDDGRHLLIYTGVMPDGHNYIQTQCIALEDNGNYIKYENNPVIGTDTLPEGANKRDFRDPKIWRNNDGTFACVTVDKKTDGNGRVLYYTSPDGFTWSFKSVLAENNGTYGRMWECPDFFELDGTHVLLVSPMDMRQNATYYNGNGNVCLIGTFNEAAGWFTPTADQPVDCGIDFYATQTLQIPDGRRVMVAWMQNWDTVLYVGEDLPWAGQMTVPRELHVQDGKLIQKPIRELDELRCDPVVYHNELMCGENRLNGIEGRMIDLLLDIRPAEPGSLKSFEIRLAEQGDTYTSLCYDCGNSTLEFDRSNSGTRRNVANTRKCSVSAHGDKLSLRILLDRFSCEVFINGGEQVMSHVLYTEQEASGICFNARGKASIDITKYNLK